MRWCPAIVLCALATVGCSSELARQSRVDGPRLLAITAEPPEVAPGDRVVVSALWFDGDEDAPVFHWSHCPAPADGSVDRCAGVEEELGSGADLAETSFLAPGDTSTDLVRLSVGAVDAAKRVQIGSSTTPNHNPGIESFAIDPAGEGANVTLDAAADAVEEDEELFVSWFATAGTFDDDRSFGPGPLRFEIHWDPPGDAGAVTMWAVLRDGRGGVTWEEQAATIE